MLRAPAKRWVRYLKHRLPLSAAPFRSSRRGETPATPASLDKELRRFSLLSGAGPLPVWLFLRASARLMPHLEESLALMRGDGACRARCRGRADGRMDKGCLLEWEA